MLVSVMDIERTGIEGICHIERESFIGWTGVSRYDRWDPLEQFGFSAVMPLLRESNGHGTPPNPALFAGER
jgi:hypothetical protein